MEFSKVALILKMSSRKKYGKAAKIKGDLLMSSVSDERILEVLEEYMDGILSVSESTYKKYRSEAKRRGLAEVKPVDEEVDDDSLFEALKEHYTIDELKKLARAPRHYPEGKKEIKFDGDKLKFAFVTDTHFGAACFNENCWDAFLKTCKEEEVEFIAHAGDLTDGTPMRRLDTIFGMEVVGYANQKRYARELLSKTDIPMYIISGNHDRFYRSAQIVEDICETLPHCHYTGEDRGTITIHMPKRDLNILMWHGDDGSSGQSYSLRTQKVLDGLSCFEPVDVLLTGHTHKACVIYNEKRNVHAVSGGCLCGQSDWMRSKKLDNHQGFYILEVTVGERGVTKFTSTWYPLNEWII